MLILKTSEIRNISTNKAKKFLNSTNVSKKNSIDIENVIFTIEISNKIYYPLMYKKVISDQIYFRYQKGKIEEEI